MELQMAHAVLSRRTLTPLGVTEMVILISAVHSICLRTWCTCSNIAFACGFLIVVGLRLILIQHESNRYSKFNLNSLPLLYTKYQHLVYLLNQNLLTNQAIQSELLSKISLTASNSLPSTSIVVNCLTRHKSKISNQLDAGFIMVRTMKSMTEPSLPLRVYGLTRLTPWLAMLGFLSVGCTPQMTEMCVCWWHVSNVGPARQQNSVKLAIFGCRCRVSKTCCQHKILHASRNQY